MLKNTIHLIFVLLISSSGFAQVKNIVLPIPKMATYLFSQVEPSIFIDPGNSKRIIAGSVMNDYYYSKDGGNSWKSKSISSPYGVNGDPCLLIDQKGYHYYFHLSNLAGERLKGGIVCERFKKY